MPLILSGNVASATAGAYEVANSCRFDDGSSAYMTFTPSGAPTSARIATVSFWMKLGNVGVNGKIFTADKTGGAHANTWKILTRDANGTLEIQQDVDTSNAYSLRTSQLFRDPSAWYHVVVAFDTTQATDSNRIKLYVNGTQVTSFSQEDYPAQDLDLDLGASGEAHDINRDAAYDAAYWDGYLAEFVYIDGQQLAPTSFGEFDEDSPTIWKPKNVSGLTFGNNGFYLDFEDSAALGDDKSGNSNDYTTANLAAADQATDTPTNNFATMNPLDIFYSDATFSEGNCKVVGDNTKYAAVMSTIGMSSGKWYAEFKCTDAGSGYPMVGIKGKHPTSNGDGPGSATDGYAYYGYLGYKVTNAGVTSYGDAYTDDDIIGVAVDLDNNKIYWSKNGTFQDSGDPTSGATGTGSAFDLGAPSSGFYYFGVNQEDNAGNGTWDCNFGGCPAFTISSSNADADGYGNFEYAVPSGYYALCTKNLAEYG